MSLRAKCFGESWKNSVAAVEGHKQSGLLKRALVVLI